MLSTTWIPTPWNSLITMALFSRLTSGQMADLDWLLYNAPMEYASLVLSGEMENYLKGPALHGIED